MIQSESEGEDVALEATKDTRQVSWPGGTVEAMRDPGDGVTRSGLSAVVSH
jgi:hypothetical protein